MFGCLRRLGCLALILGIAAGLWFTRDRWGGYVFGERAAPTVDWRAVTDAGEARAKRSVESLGRGSGPAFISLTAEELGALLLAGTGNRLPSSLTNPELAISNDRVHLRATVQLDDIRGLDGLGPLTALMKGREALETSGTLHIIRPGLAEYRVEAARIADLQIPRPMIPRLRARISTAERQEGVAENGIPFEIPAHIGDVRVARGRVTLYKNVQ